MLSVIVPVFNAEKYLEKCIKSILSQTYTDIQVILVDDGSADSSGAICDSFCKSDDRIEVIHTDNQGAISARITGFDHANGEYVTFVDADDWIDEKMYSELIPRLIDNNSDFIPSGVLIEDKYRDINIDGLEEGTYDQCNYEYLGLAMWSFTSGKCGILPSLSNKLFKKEYLKDIFSKIDNSITLGDDRAIFYISLLAAKRFIITYNTYYHYRIHSESMCHDISKAGFDHVWMLWKFMKDNLENIGVYDSIKDHFERNIQEVLDVAERNAYGITSVNYVFPFSEIPKSSRLIIYGFGVVGKAYCKQLLLTKFAQIVAIADRAQAGTSFNGIPIVGIDEIPSYTYDCVLIANLRECIADGIKVDLLKLGIDEKLIKWIKPLLY